MKTTLKPADLAASVIAVPPLCRDAGLTIQPQENARLIRYLEAGGVRLFLYGGNANFYNIAPGEYEGVLDALEAAAGPDSVVIPSVGPYFGTMMDQASVLARRNFPTAMVLPTMAVSSPTGVQEAVLRFVERTGRPAVLYIKDENYVTVEVTKALMAAGVLSWIKYAVVRADPAHDPLLRALVDVIDPRLIISGIGEQPALTHVRDFGCGGFTSGCVCVAPGLSMAMLRDLRDGDFEAVEHIQSIFRPLEDLRNSQGPIAVLHHAVAAAGIAETGPMLPLLTALDPERVGKITPVARELRWHDEAGAAVTARRASA